MLICHVHLITSNALKSSAELSYNTHFSSLTTIFNTNLLQTFVIVVILFVFLEELDKVDDLLLDYRPALYIPIEQLDSEPLDPNIVAVAESEHIFF